MYARQAEEPMSSLAPLCESAMAVRRRAAALRQAPHVSAATTADPRVCTIGSDVPGTYWP